jgi:hypothetical protein
MRLAPGSWPAKLVAASLLSACSAAYAAEPRPARAVSASGSGTSLARFVSLLRGKAKALEGTTGMRSSFASFTAAYKLKPESVSYSDYVMIRMLYEATRDAGFWNLHWTITDQPPNSDKIWRQWHGIKMPSFTAPTASAECDELSALYAFLAGRAGVHEVGLFWPASNHTVAVWVVHPANHVPVRVVVPTSQIFLDVTDSLGTKKFDPWRQKTIYEYRRSDAPDSFDLPRPLFDLFLSQVDKYAGASDSTLQQLRYLREGVFRNFWTAEQAAHDALKRRSDLGPSAAPEDLAAFQHFAEDMQAWPAR